MIYAIGFPNFQGIIPIETDLPIFNKGDVVVINVQNRFLFKTGSTLTSYSLKAILPNLSQREAIRQFLWNGGTIITSLVEPCKLVTTTVLKEELSCSIRDGFVHVMDETGGLIDLGIMPYDWLVPELDILPIDAYSKLQKAMCDWKKHSLQQSTVLSRDSIEMICYDVGGGHLVFTPLLNKLTDLSTLRNLLGLMEKYVSKKEPV